MSRTRPALFVLLVFFLAACDSTGGDETAFFTQDQIDEIELSFRFEGSEQPVGEVFAVEADVLDHATLAAAVDAYLEDLGFTRADLISAELVEVELYASFPARVTWNFLDAAVLELRAANASPDIAGLSTFPDTTEPIEMDLVDGRDVAGVLRRDEAAFRLSLTAEELVQDADRDDYEIVAELRFRFEVQL